MQDFMIEKDKYNLWRYAHLYAPYIKPSYQLTLEEGWTKELEIRPLTESLGLEHLWFKREDLNPTGSHKARSLAYQVSKYHQEGKNLLVISSSGNAAISAAAYCRLAGIKLVVFISPLTPKFKIEQLNLFEPVVISTPKPINMARYAARHFNLVNLRPSVDDASIEGFKSIGFEIHEKGLEPEAIFVFPTSGSSLLGIGRAFLELKEKYGRSGQIPQIHAVQSGKITSVVKDFVEDSLNTATCSAKSRGCPDSEEEESLAGYLGVKNTPRKEEILKMIRLTGGRGWWVSSGEILEAISLLNHYGINTSAEGAANFAGVIKAVRESGLKKVLCLLTGHYSQWERKERRDSASTYKVEQYRQVKELIGTYPLQI
ncbi:MAG: pyridoxal-phosphate dependent enzyme [bacterium]|nr:pyridoxal-phosphate dependent enzyme [bacterium]